MAARERKPDTKTFDPFNDRRSRDLRNTLSEMLKTRLRRQEPFTTAIGDLLKDYPQPPYTDYIRDRVNRYRQATQQAIPLGDSPVGQAAVLWQHELYFEVHEILEPHWQAATGKAREGLKGLIQAAGVFVHREAGHDRAAATLARKAADRLRQYGDAIDPDKLMDLGTLVDQLEDLIAAFQKTG